jgi:hypothetical protein
VRRIIQAKLDNEAPIAILGVLLRVVPQLAVRQTELHRVVLVVDDVDALQIDADTDHLVGCLSPQRLVLGILDLSLEKHSPVVAPHPATLRKINRSAYRKRSNNKNNRSNRKQQ